MNPPVTIGVQFPEPTLPTAPALNLISEEIAQKEYVTLRGDSLVAIAEKFKVSVDVLKRVNNLPDNQLRVPVGTSLIIP